MRKIFLRARCPVVFFPGKLNTFTLNKIWLLYLLKISPAIARIKGQTDDHNHPSDNAFLFLQENALEINSIHIRKKYCNRRFLLETTSWEKLTEHFKNSKWQSEMINEVVAATSNSGLVWAEQNKSSKIARNFSRSENIFPSVFFQLLMFLKLRQMFFLRSHSPKALPPTATIHWQHSQLLRLEIVAATPSFNKTLTGQKSCHLPSKQKKQEYTFLSSSQKPIFLEVESIASWRSRLDGAEPNFMSSSVFFDQWLLLGKKNFFL